MCVCVGERTRDKYRAFNGFCAKIEENLPAQAHTYIYFCTHARTNQPNLCKLPNHLKSNETLLNVVTWLHLILCLGRATYGFSHFALLTPFITCWENIEKQIAI